MIVVSLALVAVFAAVTLFVIPSSHHSRFDRRDRHLATIIGWCIVLGGAGLGTLPWIGTEEPLRTPEAALASAVLGALIAAPGLMTLLGVRTGRAGMLLPAAIVLVPLSFISFALVTLPLLIPAVLLFRLAARSVASDRWPRTLLAGAAGTIQLVAALACYFALRVERSWTTDGLGGGGTTGWVPWSTSSLVSALIATAILTTYVIAGPSNDRGGSDED